MSSLGVSGPKERNVAVDAYRGFVMLLMMGEVLRFAEVAKSFPGSLFWRVLAYNQSHVEWTGMTQPTTLVVELAPSVALALKRRCAAIDVYT